MAKKPQPKPVATDSTTEDIVLCSLKERYFRLLGKENYPHTKDLTKEIDAIEKKIREIVEENAYKAANS